MNKITFELSIVSTGSISNLLDRYFNSMNNLKTIYNLSSGYILTTNTISNIWPMDNLIKTQLDYF
jgi:hypothetical protein